MNRGLAMVLTALYHFLAALVCLRTRKDASLTDSESQGPLSEASSNARRKSRRSHSGIDHAAYQNALQGLSQQQKTLEEREAQLSWERRRAQALQEKYEAEVAHNRTLRDTSAQLEDEANRSAAEARRLQTMNTSLDAKISTLQSQHAVEVEEVRSQLKAARADASRCELDVKNKAISITQLQRAVASLEKERSDTTALLEQRTVALTQAETFLTLADNIADSEVIKIVEPLNSKIFHTAASIAESSAFRYDIAHPTASTHEASRALEQQGWLGLHLLTALGSIDHSNDSILVQTALQAMLVEYVRRLASNWGRYDPNGLLHQLYRQVKEREPQSVAGKWRALSRISAKALVGKDDSTPETCARDLVVLVVDVLLACRLSYPSKDVTRSTIQRSFGASLREIAKLTLEFRRIAGEVIISRDLALEVVQHDSRFNPATMDDQWADPKRPTSDGDVLCTTDLGLKKEELKSPGVVHATLLVKPKVALRSMLQQLWNEMSPTAAGPVGS